MTTIARPDTSLRGDADLAAFLNQTLRDFPHEIIVQGPNLPRTSLGRKQAHWFEQPLELTIRSDTAVRHILHLNAYALLECFLRDEIEFSGNLFLLSDLTYSHLGLKLKPWQLLLSLLRNVAFQTISRAQHNVKSHYDIPQRVIDSYLDQVYLSYSCGMFEDPAKLDSAEHLKVGEGQTDRFDSLEKAQWNKFRDAIDFIAPAESDTVVDIGCGYGGQLKVAMERHAFRKMVGWTHSHNQVVKGRELLGAFDAEKWELNEGDYRQDDRIYDHVTSTGMVSHVGRRGLEPYARNIRRRIKQGGRYLHHALMAPWHPYPLEYFPGITFNKRYVWPGFHWFTVGEHVRALERNGFRVEKLVNLSPHYAKTTACWYQRFMANRAANSAEIGEATVRAWMIYLAGASGGFLNNHIHVYRLYCTAV